MCFRDWKCWGLHGHKPSSWIPSPANCLGHRSISSHIPLGLQGPASTQFLGNYSHFTLLLRGSVERRRGGGGRAATQGREWLWLTQDTQLSWMKNSSQNLLVSLRAEPWQKGLVLMSLLWASCCFKPCSPISPSPAKCSVPVTASCGWYTNEM